MIEVLAAAVTLTAVRALTQALMQTHRLRPGYDAPLVRPVNCHDFNFSISPYAPT